MTLAEALDIVSPPGRDRYRQLCDPAHPDYDPRYIAIVMRRAAGEPTVSIGPVRPPSIPVDYANGPGPRPCCGSAG